MSKTCQINCQIVHLFWLINNIVVINCNRYDLKVSTCWDDRPRPSVCCACVVVYKAFFTLYPNHRALYLILSLFNVINQAWLYNFSNLFRLHKYTGVNSSMKNVKRYSHLKLFNTGLNWRIAYSRL